ncbi:MAG: prephenate dehydrogenase/arogenate dehydrogenase family protein [Myxococcales bacterium]|nr:prephenate dehydrogenase/arogenate dehydrogenase family protein [Myxococcales bacterium]
MICIVGFGLIGGSIAAALAARRPETEVVAIDTSSAIEPGNDEFFGARVLAAEASEAVDAELARADLVVLAAPVSVITAELPRVLSLARVVTDAGSTKRQIAEVAARSRRAGVFVPGHPLAGGSRSGRAAAHAELFAGKRWILCPDGASEAALEAVRGFVVGLGAEPVLMSAATHDRALALTSHVPQLLASVLVVLSERRGSRAAEGPGFASATRVAGGNPAIWRDILVTNADEVAAVLRELQAELGRVAEGLERAAPDVEAALALIHEARARGSSSD